MKLLGNLILSTTLLGVIVSSCTTPPVFENEPIISDLQVKFIEVNEPASARDTLAIAFHFTDGDGDLGLGPEETFYPFNLRDYQISPITDDTIRFGDPEAGDYPFEFPYTCLNWELKFKGYEIIDNQQVAIFDTLLYTQNENHYNITIDWFVKPNGQSEWEPFDWVLFRPPSCGETFDGRFPRLFDEDRVEDDGTLNPFPLEGDLQYSMNSDGFLLLFGADSIRIDVQIKDRQLRPSNTLSKAFTLQGVQQGG
ncbi:MAG: hypothetical protein AAFQ98_01695 [Bacteroidota bacterium]